MPAEETVSPAARRNEPFGRRVKWSVGCGVVNAMGTVLLCVVYPKLVGLENQLAVIYLFCLVSFVLFLLGVVWGSSTVYWRQCLAANLTFLAIYGCAIAIEYVRSPPLYGPSSVGLGESATDESLAHLEPSIQSLQIHSARISDQGLASLAHLKRLERLDLSNCPITDAGIIHFVSQKSLKSLKIKNTQVTPAGIAQLRRERPDLEIEW